MGEVTGHRVFDAHLHIIDPAYPLLENNGYLPPPFTAREYRDRVAHLDVGGGAVVSGSFQGFDQTYLRAALGELGPGFVGVTQVPVDVDDDDIRELDADGVRAVRVNVLRGGSAAVTELDRLARRVHEVAGWHTELYIDSRALADITPTLLALPAISIDHLGMSDEGLDDLLHLVDNGAHVKATGFGRVDLEPMRVIREIMRINPQALMFGTDLPSTRARRPFRDEDLDVVAEAVGGDHLDDVLWHNAARFYRVG